MVLVLVGGLVTSVGLMFAVQGQHNAHLAQAMDQRATAVGEAVTGEIDRYTDTISDLAVAVGAQSDLSAADFGALTSRLDRHRLPGASAAVLVVPATDAQIPAVQRYWRVHGSQGLTLASAGRSREHLFVVLSRSLDGTPAKKGRDLTQADEPTQALLMARSRGELTASSTYVLLKDRSLPVSAQQLSFVLVAPVYGGAGTPDAGRFRAWILMGLRGSDFLNETLVQASQRTVAVNLLDASTARTQAVAVAGTGDALQGQGRLRRVVPITVAGRPWQLVIAPARGMNAVLRPSLTLAAGGVGVLLTLLLSALVGALSTSRNRAMVQVERATGALREDIERREVVESQLRERERELQEAAAASRRDAGLLSAVMDSIGDGVGVVDSNGQFLLHNAAAKAMLGVADDVAGPELWQEHYGLFRPDGHTPFPTAEMPLVRALAGEATDLVDMVCRNEARPEGVMISVTGRPVELAAVGMDGRGAVAVFHDVTERRRQGAELRVQHDRYERLLGILSDLGEGVLVRTGYQITYVNDAYTQLTGYSREELFALTDTAVLAADAQSLAEFAAIGEQLGTDAKAEVHLTRIRRKDGRVVPIEVAGMRLDDVTLNTSERVFVVRDRTESKRAELELAERARALQEANAQLQEARAVADAASHAKSQFLTTMSHEIRTPLNGVLGFTALLAESPHHPDAPQWATTADSAGRALLDIVNNGLDLAKIEAGAVDLEAIELDLLDIARQSMLPCRLTAQDTGLDLRLLIGDGLACIRLGDPVRLRQIMTNLISNAVKFTPAGSVTLALDGHGDQLRIRIIDTGIGMDAEQQQRLFTPFQQAAPDTTRRYGGTGLGLSIAAGLIHAMGGTISLTSEPGEGTTFTVDLHLPRTNDRARETSLGEPVEADLAVLSGLRVLVAEDNLTNQVVARAMFQKRGLRLDVVDDGQAAVTAALSGDYDAIFMDCQMPVMDGMEATRRIRASTSGHRIPIIAMTANTYEEERQACSEAGMNDFLPKPWTAQQLTDVFTRLVQQHLSHRPT